MSTIAKRKESPANPVPNTNPSGPGVVYGNT